MNNNEKLQKKFHLINFTVKALIIGFIVFCTIQLIAVHIIGIRANSAQPDSSGFYGHNYCGTFFIEITRENSFVDEESYLNALQPADTHIIQDILINTISVVMILSLLIFLHRADKKTIHKKRTAWLLILSGCLYAAGNTFLEIKAIAKDISGFKGIMATQSYYPQLYVVYGIPAVLIFYGLILLYYEQYAQDKGVVGVGRTLKGGAVLTGAIALGFILWRFIERCYELINAVAGGENNARLPFYSSFLDLPKSEVVTKDAYAKVLMLRFVKDLPVFVASIIAVLVLIKLMYSAANGQINTAENRRNLKRAALILAISSVIFNLLGIIEVKTLNESFIGIYGDVTYTIGIRSGCEPMLYAFLLIAIEIYIQAIPKIKSARQ